MVLILLMSFSTKNPPLLFLLYSLFFSFMSRPHIDLEDFRVKPGSEVNLKKIKTDEVYDWFEELAMKKFEENRKKIIDLQELLYAEGKQSLLVVLQAMDAAGKDSTIKAVTQ